MARSRDQQHPSPHERAAARKYLEHDYASTHLGGRAGQQANAHAQAIDEEHPRARDIALTGTERELGELPSQLRRHQLEARRQANIDREQAARLRREYRSRPYHEPQDEPESPSVRDRASSLAGQAGGVAASGAKAAANSNWGELILEFFAWGMALSIGYLLMTKTKGVVELFSGATNVTRAIISPHIDPLNPKGTL